MYDLLLTWLPCAQLYRPAFGEPFQSGDAGEQQRVGAIVRRHAIVVGWDTDFEDYTKKDAAAYNAAYPAAIASGKPGDILLHCQANDAGSGAFPDTLSKLINDLKTQGFTFITVEEYVQKKFGMSSADVVAACSGGGGQTTPAPKDDAPKDDAPKDDAPKDDAPKDDAPQENAPKDEGPKDDAPQDDAPQDDAPQDDVPKDDAPKDDALKDDAPKDDAPQDDAPKDDAPQDGPEDAP
jgi:hypothetical protein